jgi:hypothetical protein
MRALIFIYQVFSPAKAIFAGIGVLLLVRISLDSVVRAHSDSEVS